MGNYNLTPQQIFDKVSAHLMQQGQKSMAERELFVGRPPKPVCCYRGDGGTSCAVGCLISDEDYKPEMESWTAGQLQDKPFVSPELRNFLGNNSELLYMLQRTHDRYEVEDWPTRLREVAESFGLSCSLAAK